MAIRKRFKLVMKIETEAFHGHPGRRLPPTLARWVCTGLLLFIVFACASSPVTPDKVPGPGIAVVPMEARGLFAGPPADAVMINAGVSWLAQAEKPSDYVKARETFAALTKNHPESRWRPLAETFIRLIDVIISLQTSRSDAQEAAEMLQRENERIKKDIQVLGTRFHAERAGLMQENEELKKDLELLKKLEVQLDQRGKMLR